MVTLVKPSSARFVSSHVRTRPSGAGFSGSDQTLVSATITRSPQVDGPRSGSIRQDELAPERLDILKPVGDEVAAWCREQGRPFDGAARSEFTVESMRNGTARYLDEKPGRTDVRQPERVAEQRDAADEVRDGQRRRGPRS